MKSKCFVILAFSIFLFAGCDKEKIAESSVDVVVGDNVVSDAAQTTQDVTPVDAAAQASEVSATDTSGN